MKYDVYFSNVPNVGKLFIMYVFYEDVHPILFLCKDEENNKYLCHCFEFRYVQKWNIIKISENDIAQMLEGKKSVYRIFQEEKNQIFRIVYDTDRNETYKRVQFMNIYPLDLPEEDFYLNKEDYPDFFIS